jgi:hypothetical protein
MLTFTSLDQNTLQARRTLRHKKAPGNFPILSAIIVMISWRR